MATRLVQIGYADGNNSLPATNVALSADGGVDVDAAVAHSTNNEQVNIAIAHSALVLLYLISNQPLTLKTNSTSAPDNTLTLAAGVPLVWYAGCGLSCPLTADVTTIYATNGGSIDATLTIRVLQDVTP